MEATVFVIDDDPAARESVCTLVRSMKLTAESFASAESFLEAFQDSRLGCVVTDVRMLGMSGIELVKTLRERDCLLPVIVLTAYATTHMTVSAMQAGAVTMLDKPYSEDELWDAISKSLVQNSQLRETTIRRTELRSRFEQLTPKEREVLKLVVHGYPNKVIAKQLEVSIRTVENRRRVIYAKMGATTVVELVQLVIEGELLEPIDQPVQLGA